MRHVYLERGDYLPRSQENDDQPVEEWAKACFQTKPCRMITVDQQKNGRDVPVAGVNPYPRQMPLEQAW